MLIGVSLRPQYTDWAPMREAALALDELGFEWLLTSDHLIASDSHRPDPDGPIFEAWQLVAAWAAITQRVQIGVMVSSVTLRHPALLAKVAITLDHVSDGRAICGVGAGWFEAENKTYGIEWNDTGERLTQLEEAARILRSLFDEPRTTFRGSHYRLIDAPASPKPLQTHLPLLIGGGGERRTMRIAARYADIWNGFGSPATMIRKLEILRRHCIEAGRDPSAIRPSVTVMFNPNEGSAEIAAQLAEYQDAGVDAVIIDLPAPFDLPLLERVAHEVRPELP